MADLVERNLLHVRLNGGARTHETYYLGPTSECPPLPRVGETVDLDAIYGPVTGLTHAMETIGTHVVYHVDIEIAAEGRRQPADPGEFWRRDR